MPVNPYFNHTTFTSEQNLIDSLIVESIQIYGHDTAYLIREDVNLDKLFGEDDLAKYQTAIPVEMYIKSVQSFSGQSEFMTKFGLHIEDQCTFSVAKSRWVTETANTSLVRPRENDIIWLQFTPTNRYLFEIRFVEDKEELFQLGKLYTYELRCELMNYSHERVITGNTVIDGVADLQTYTLALNVTNVTPNTSYILNETVYQGDVNTPTATGLVVSFAAASNAAGTLSVECITGTFDANNGPIVSASSGLTATLGDTPDPLISAVAPDSDNIFDTNAAQNIITIRGTNPRTS